jgi:hypothetical protein
MMASAAVHARAGEVVQGVAGGVVSVLEKREGEGRSTASGRGRVPSRPGTCLARSGAFCEAWARAGQVSARVSSVDGVHERAQEGEVSVQDMVRGTREGWR